jgi:hypothetical protein
MCELEGQASVQRNMVCDIEDEFWGKIYERCGIGGHDSACSRGNNYSSKISVNLWVR